MNIIFLDIDGVLNSESDFGPHKENPHLGHRRGLSNPKLDLLKKLVSLTEAKLVLVSSWKVRYEKYLKNHEDEVGVYLFNKLKEFDLSIYDTTLKYDLSNGKDRGLEITSWLIDHQKEVSNWIILEDEEYPDYERYDILSHLIKTDMENGLTDEIVAKAVSALNK